jgi:hypothetical protein
MVVEHNSGADDNGTFAGCRDIWRSDSLGKRSEDDLKARNEAGSSRLCRFWSAEGVTGQCGYEREVSSTAETPSSSEISSRLLFDVDVMVNLSSKEKIVSPVWGGGVKS